MNSKIQTRYIDYGLGFPVTLLQVPMLKVRGKWTPNINYNILFEEVLRSLANFDGRLTGAQIKFIRHHFEMTLQDFAERFVVTHPAVIKWEKTTDKATGMNWSTEKDIRLFIINQLNTKSGDFQALYQQLEKVPKKRRATIQLSGEKVAA